MQVKRIMVFNLFGLVLFGLMFASVHYGVGIIDLDHYVHTQMQQLRQPWLTEIMTIVTHMNDLQNALLFSLCMVVLFLWLKWYKESLFFVTVTLCAAALFGLIKQAVQRMRPDAAVIEVGGYSFPSGHTTMATAMAFALYFILAEHTQAHKTVLFLAALLWAGLIASTRLYLGVHWLSDVLGGFGLGLFWVTTVKLVYVSVQR